MFVQLKKVYGRTVLQGLSRAFTFQCLEEDWTFTWSCAATHWYRRTS